MKSKKPNIAKLKFNKRVWLNPDTSPSTGSVCLYDGPASFTTSINGDRPRMIFLEVADCHQTARIHLTDTDSPKAFIEKIETLRDVLDQYLKAVKK